MKYLLEGVLQSKLFGGLDQSCGIVMYMMG